MTKVDILTLKAGDKFIYDDLNKKYWYAVISVNKCIMEMNMIGEDENRVIPFENIKGVMVEKITDEEFFLRQVLL